MIATTTRTPTALWRPCPICWGQRRVYEDRNGEGLVPHACPACLGVGDALASIT